ncbi:perforin-1-like isoform X2 [Brienomyrus brachyistius]|uniref:perforin-1-like isoform X2 n=1 Tax=Brienomyrus brachyistius TaxID=42636 RepID=UPI0020B1C40A|nr:perforin-1-like isoform X2 [Brienomyrus brachyistius]
MWWLFVLWLWGCWLPPGFPHCTTERNPLQCLKAKMVPGSYLAGEGFDVVTMERKGAYVIDVDHWQRTTDNSCTLCTNPYLNNEKQKLPLALVDWRAEFDCEKEVASSVYESSEQFVESGQSGVDISWKEGLDLISPRSGSLIVGGTHSKQASKAMEISKKDKYSFIKQEFHCSYYRYRVVDSPPLQRKFVRSLELLPPLYNSVTKRDYRRLLDIYGTHFIRKVQLGGRVSSTTAVRYCQAAQNGYNETEVKDCLEVEASLSIKSVSVKAKADFCEREKKQRNIPSFHSQFTERITEVKGGQHMDSDSLLSDKPEAMQKWLDSLKTMPGIITYSLHPLHFLVQKPKTKKAALKKAVEDYILEKALYKHCSRKCSGGSTPSKLDPCHCVCVASKQTNCNCCPTMLGLAQVTVTVKWAQGLWGDQYDETDGFVYIALASKNTQTRVIHNNNNAIWNTEFPFGTIQLSQNTKMRLEVWDEDKMWYKWWNDKLGECTINPVRGFHDKICPLNHGNLYYSYKVECAPGLTGEHCSDYAPSPMNSRLADLYTSRNAFNVTPVLLERLRTGQVIEDPLPFLLSHRSDNKTLGSSGGDTPHAPVEP